jgi:hypothetical protein
MRVKERVTSQKAIVVANARWNVFARQHESSATRKSRNVIRSSETRTETLSRLLLLALALSRNIITRGRPARGVSIALVLPVQTLLLTRRRVQLAHVQHRS